MGLISGDHIVGKSQEVEAQIQCGCHTERMIVTRWTDDPFPTEMYFTMWHMAGHAPSKIAWRCRWRFIWRIIRKGEPYLDQVAVAEDEARELGQWLLDNTREATDE